MNKKAVTLAIILGAASSAASAQSTSSHDGSRLTLAMATSTEARWSKFSMPIEAIMPRSNIELKISERMEQLTADINTQMESRLARKANYATQ